MDRIGNYRIVSERRRDGAGIVYEARHLVLPRRAIVKVMDAPDTQDAAVALLREACILEALDHPGVVRVYESGLLADRRPWFAHEWVDGPTVADVLVPAPLDPGHAAILLRDIAEVLDHAHRKGIVHCGLRPDRIVITGRARGFPLCIVNWGDARTHDTTTPLAPVPFTNYCAPELISGDSVDDRVDVFALGVMGYHALTGELPFHGTVDRQHVPTEVRCAEAPPELTGLVDQMLAWDRWDRPSSWEARGELAQLADSLAPPHPSQPMIMRIRKPKWTPSTSYENPPDTVAPDVTDESEKS